MQMNIQTDNADTNEAPSENLRSIEMHKMLENGLTDIYQIKMYFGSPNPKLSSSIRRARKEDIVDQLRLLGVPEAKLKAKRTELLQMLQYDLPSLTFRIDGREDITSCLGAFLTTWCWDLSHIYSVTMPARGQSTFGVEVIYRDFEFYGSCYLRRDNPEVVTKLVKRIQQHYPLLSETEQNAFIGKILEPHEIKSDNTLLGPYRKFHGSFSQSGNYSEADIVDDAAADMIEYLSLSKLALRKHDKVEIVYDLGDREIITLQVMEIEKNVPPLDEINYNNLPIRIQILEKSSNKPPQQYESDLP
jgi:hypothetical protein